MDFDIFSNLILWHDIMRVFGWIFFIIDFHYALWLFILHGPRLWHMKQLEIAMWTLIEILK
jgi:hypothetical protein